MRWTGIFGLDKIDSVQAHPALSIVKDDLRYCDVSVFDGVDTVMDLAGLSNDASAEIDPELTRQINYKGSERFAREAKKAGVKRYIYSSSASVYGAGNKTSLSEGMNFFRKPSMQKARLPLRRYCMNCMTATFTQQC